MLRTGVLRTGVLRTGVLRTGVPRTKSQIYVNNKYSSQALLVNTGFSSTFGKQVADFEAEPQGFLFIEPVDTTPMFHLTIIETTIS